MKKIFTILSLVISTSISTSAQVRSNNINTNTKEAGNTVIIANKEGRFMLGTNTKLNYSTLTPEDGESQSILLLNGLLGYFISNNFSCGVSLSHASKTIFEDEASSGYGGFLRYYSENFYSHLGYNVGDYLYLGVLPIEEYGGIDLGFGYCVWIGDHIAFEPSILYTILRSEGDFIGNKLDFQIGFGVYL